jgi:hypothetical protein
MVAPARELFTVDLRGLKPALLARAQANGISPSDLMRAALAQALEVALPARGTADGTGLVRGTPGRTVQVYLRLTASESQLLLSNARAAGMSKGDYVGALMSGATVSDSSSIRAAVAALTESNAEIAAIGRNLNQLVRLLNAASGRAAEHRETFRTLAAQVRGHIENASQVLAHLRQGAHARRAEAQAGSAQRGVQRIRASTVSGDLP